MTLGDESHRRLFFEDGDWQVRKSSVHALVIGVGDYPYFPGGDPGAATSLPFSFATPQLRSPPYSALHFARWLSARDRIWRNYQDDAVGLGTIDLLASGVSGLGIDADTAQNVLEPTLDSIDNAFAGWRERCNQRENIAVLYFCGHGAQHKRSVFIFPSDAGKDAATMNPWGRVVDFTETHFRMSKCEALTQCYFLDVCRGGLDEAPEGAHILGPNPLRRPDNALTNPIYFATKFDYPALGADEGQPSLFTSALVDALERSAIGGRPWLVTPTSLSDGIHHLLSWHQHDSHPDMAPQIPDREGSCIPRTLYELSSAPHVYAEVTCVPGKENEYAEFTLSGPSKCSATREALRKLIAPGKYYAEVRVIEGKNKGSSQRSTKERVMPPVHRFPFQIN